MEQKLSFEEFKEKITISQTYLPSLELNHSVFEYKGLISVNNVRHSFYYQINAALYSDHHIVRHYDGLNFEQYVKSIVYREFYKRYINSEVSPLSNYFSVEDLF